MRDLVALTEEDLLKIKNFGKKSFDEVMEALATFNLSWGQMLVKLGQPSMIRMKNHEPSEWQKKY